MAGIPQERPLSPRLEHRCLLAGAGGGAGEGQSGGFCGAGTDWLSLREAAEAELPGTLAPAGRHGWAEALTAVLDAGHLVIRGAGEPRCWRECAGGM